MEADLQRFLVQWLPKRPVVVCDNRCANEPPSSPLEGGLEDQSHDQEGSLPLETCWSQIGRNHHWLGIVPYASLWIMNASTPLLNVSLNVQSGYTRVERNPTYGKAPESEVVRPVAASK